MLDKLKTYLLYGNRFCAVEHSLKASENIVYVTGLKKSKNELDIENAFEASSIEN